MVKIKNIDASATLEVTVIKETTTSLAPGEEQDIAIDPAQERMEVKSVP